MSEIITQIDVENLNFVVWWAAVFIKWRLFFFVLEILAAGAKES